MNNRIPLLPLMALVAALGRNRPGSPSDRKPSPSEDSVEALLRSKYAPNSPDGDDFLRDLLGVPSEATMFLAEWEFEPMNEDKQNKLQKWAEEFVNKDKSQLGAFYAVYVSSDGTVRHCGSCEKEHLNKDLEALVLGPAEVVAAMADRGFELAQDKKEVKLFNQR